MIFSLQGRSRFAVSSLGSRPDMNKFTVKLFAYFRDNRFKQKECEYPAGTTVLDIIHDLEIAPDEVGVLMINSRHCQEHAEPVTGDNLAIFPKVGGG